MGKRGLRRVLWCAGLGLVAIVASGGFWILAPRALDVLASRGYRFAPDSPLDRGRAAYRGGRWSDAADAARAALQVQPHDPESLRLLARATGRMNNDENAEKLFAKLGVESLQVEDLAILADGYLRRNLKERAYAVLNLARLKSPNDPEATSLMARLYLTADRHDEAAKLAERLARTPGWETRGAVMLGMICFEESEPAQAASALAAALRRDPTLRGTLHSPEEIRKVLARCLLRQGRPAEARKEIRSLVTTGTGSGGDPEAAWLLSRTFLQEGRMTEALDSWTHARSYREREPLEPEAAPFVGAARCAECHRAIYQTQQSSRHARTYLDAADGLDAFPLPEGPVKDPADPKYVHSMRREGGKVRWETRAEDKTYRAVVDYVFGTTDGGMTAVGKDEGGKFRELRLSRFSHGPIWDVTLGHPASPDRPEDFMGAELASDGARHCLECHTTDPAAAQARIQPLVADHGIGCERCHGPGAHHLKTVGNQFPDMAIARPKIASAAQVTQLCAQCHGAHGRSMDPADPATVRHYGTTLTWSRCYTESGRLSCVTCHDPHRDASKSQAFYEAKCLTCHAPESSSTALARPNNEAPSASSSARRVECSVNPLTGCVKCHMPASAGGAAHKLFTDHNIRIHSGANAGG